MTLLSGIRWTGHLRPCISTVRPEVNLGYCPHRIEMRVHASHHPLILIRADTSPADNRHTLQLLVFSLLWPDRGGCIRRAWVIPFARSLARTGGFGPMPAPAWQPWANSRLALTRVRRDKPAGNERVLQGRRQRLHLGPQSCRRHREMSLEAFVPDISNNVGPVKSFLRTLLPSLRTVVFVVVF